MGDGRAQTRPVDTGLDLVAGEPYCCVTTVGRRSGRQHTIEIWFATDGTALYLICGGGDRSDWVRNLQAAPQARVRVGDTVLDVTARVPLAEASERDRAVGLLHAKYRSQVTASVEAWQKNAFIVALDPQPTPGDAA